MGRLFCMSELGICHFPLRAKPSERHSQCERSLVYQTELTTLLRWFSVVIRWLEFSTVSRDGRLDQGRRAGSPLVLR